jgi:branched-chain amino acid transport system permease protein
MTAYLLHLVVLWILSSTLGICFTLPFACMAEMNLSLIAAYGLGAYTCGIFLIASPEWWMVSILASGAVGSLLGLAIGGLLQRIRGDQFALACLAIHFLFISLVTSGETLSGGGRGISLREGVPSSLLLESPDQFFLYAAPCLCALLSLVALYFSGSRWRALCAARDHLHSFELLGRRPFSYECAAMVVTSTVAGVAGAFFALYLAFLAPTAFSLQEVSAILLIAVVAMKKPISGSFLAASIVLLLPEALRFIPLPPEQLGPLRQLFFGVLLYFFIYSSRDKVRSSTRVV